MPNKKTFLTTRETMTEIEARTGYKVSRNTFYSWLRNGLIPQKRLGNKLFVSMSDLDIFLVDFSESNQQSTGLTI